MSLEIETRRDYQELQQELENQGMDNFEDTQHSDTENEGQQVHHSFLEKIMKTLESWEEEPSKGAFESWVFLSVS